ncbi:hypothetical protein [Brucella intermedia]|uniref:hypothetical protein n=1 Tax=Brucella intermedia TaxID=94625 RepID=UPI00224A5200|nr:hypothetical protein [Brucella intermedia]
MKSGECLGRTVITMTLEIAVQETAVGALKDYFQHELVEAMVPSTGILTAMIQETGIEAEVVSVSCEDAELTLANASAKSEK